MARLSNPEDSRAAAKVSRRRVITAAAVIAVVAAALVYVAVSPSTPARQSGTASNGPAAGAGPAGPVPSASVSYAAPDHWIALPGATGAVLQMPIGFPHTPAGAAALASAAVSWAWCGLPDQAARAAGLYAAPDQQQLAVTAATSLAGALRQDAGLPAVGPLPDGAAIQAHPYAVQYVAQGPDTVRVSVAFDLKYTKGIGQGTTSRPEVVAATIAWIPTAGSGGDWRYTLTPSTGSANYPTPAELGTPDFNTAGWLAIQGAAG